jgi:maltose alpha-D-glucosyltransferase/alpha-amylase
MQWSTEPQAGFSRAKKTAMPVISRGPFAFEKINVADQRRDPHSFLNWTERIIRMRKEVPEIGWGEFEVLDAGRDDVLAILYRWRNNEALFVHNLRDATCEVEVRLSGSGRAKLVDLLGGEHSDAPTGRHRLVLEPYGYRWYRVGGLGYILDRTAF